MMKCRKGLVAGVVAVCMMGAMGVNAFAGTQTSGKTDVKYSVTESYAWTVPSEITFTSDSGEAKSVTGTVKTGEESKISVTSNIIGVGKKLQITATGSGDKNAFSIKSTNKTNNKVETLTYALTSGGSSVTPGDVILSVDAGDNTGSNDLVFTLTTRTGVEVAGDYTGTVTYTASVVDQVTGE